MLKKIRKMASFLKGRLNTVYHLGNKFNCPLCGYSSRDLAQLGIDLPVLRERKVSGAGKRLGRCYNCGASDREKHIYLFLKERLNIFDHQNKLKILHIAPEKKLTIKILQHGGNEYICGDLFAEGYTYPKHVRHIDVLQIPFPENSFDLIICNHVLEHIPTDLAAMRELCRVLKKDGKAILMVPLSQNSSATVEDASINDPHERERLFGQCDHVRIYGQDYFQRLEQSGFSVERLSLANEFSSAGLNREEEIILCQKGTF